MIVSAPAADGNRICGTAILAVGSVPLWNHGLEARATFAAYNESAPGSGSHKLSACGQDGSIALHSAIRFL